MNARAGATVSPKKQQLIETAEELFFRHGVKRVTVEEICRKAGVSKMTFYRHFANKNELAEQIILLIFEQGYAKLDSVEAMEISFPEKLQIILEYKLEWVERMSSDYIQEYMHMIQGTLALQWFDRVRQFLMHAQERGEIRTDIRPELIMFMAEKYSEVVEDERLLKIYPNMTEFTKEVWKSFYYGILPRNSEE
jgi:AcrR family transcriptional regulator